MSKEPNRSVYVGHRYVPKIMGEWDNEVDYEGLSIVTYQGTSYTSKKRVPVGIDILNNEFWVVTGNYNAQVENYRDITERVSKDLLLKSDKSYVDTELGKKMDKKSIVINVKDFGAEGDGLTDDSNAFINAINSIKTDEYTEAVPENGVTGKIFIPSGSYKISKSIMIPSYVFIEGSGKHSTILESYITDGSPVLNISQDDTVKKQQFYNSVKGLTINGRNQECQGIRINNTSRWVIQDVNIDDTNHEGIYTYESYLGEIISTMVRACGDLNHYSVVYDGRDSNYGAHATSWFGGEVNGGGNSVNGIHVKYGNSVRFIGATIQGFRSGIGIKNGDGLATVVEGCYFEENKGHIESVNSYSFNIKGNMFGKPNEGALGHVIVEKMYGGLIEGNFFSGTGFDHVASKNSQSIFSFSKVGFNYVSGYPIRVSNVLKESGKTTGSIIETFSGDSSTLIEGITRYSDNMRTLSKLQPYGGITDLNGQVNVNILSGIGNPEGNVIATRGLYIDVEGSTGNTLYVKKSGSNNAYGWSPVQENIISSTENRPDSENVYPGFMLFDTTLGKPIWWRGSAWVDATGVEV